MKSTDLPRREFLRTASATGLAVPYLVSSSALAQPGKPGANDRLSIALVGCGGMGRANLGACSGQADVVVTGACDVWRQRREAVCAIQVGQAIRRLPRAAGSQGPGRRDHRHPAALALSDGRRRLPGQQRHLPAKAHDAAPGREPGRSQRRPQASADLPGRHANPRRGQLPPRGRVGPLRQPRQDQCSADIQCHEPGPGRNRQPAQQRLRRPDSTGSDGSGLIPCGPITR